MPYPGSSGTATTVKLGELFGWQVAAGMGGGGPTVNSNDEGGCVEGTPGANGVVVGTPDYSGFTSPYKVWGVVSKPGLGENAGRFDSYLPCGSTAGLVVVDFVPA